MDVRRLVDFPCVLVRLRCDVCKRAGAYRLARLAVKFGSEILLDDLIVRLSADCLWRDEPRGGCAARFADLPPRRPPDLPPALRMRVVKGGKAKERSAAALTAKLGRLRHRYSLFRSI